MSKQNLTKIIIGTLVLLNISLVATMLLRSGGPPFDKPPRNSKRAHHIKEQLNFDDKQMAAFELSRTKHQTAISTLRKQLHKASLAYYTARDQELIKDQLLLKVDSISGLIYKANDHHFMDIRNISSGQQEDEVIEFIKSLLERKTSRGNRPHR